MCMYPKLHTEKKGCRVKSESKKKKKNKLFKKLAYNHYFRKYNVIINNKVIIIFFLLFRVFPLHIITLLPRRNFSRYKKSNRGINILISKKLHSGVTIYKNYKHEIIYTKMLKRNNPSKNIYIWQW